MKPTDAPNSNFIGITTLHVSGSLSAHHQEFLAVHRFWYILYSCDDRLPGVGWNGGWGGMYFFSNGAAALYSGPVPSQYRGFTIALRRTTLGRTPLDEWSARHRALNLTTHNIYKRQRHPPAGFEPEIPESVWLQTHAA